MAYMESREKSKIEKYSIEAIIKKIESYELRNDHPTQRHSEQWSTKAKGNLVSDILQGNPIPELVFAEQIFSEDNTRVIWNIDGKQRTTICHAFYNNMFKVSKSVTVPVIKYDAFLRDENGKMIFNERGLPRTEKKEFDIVNKTFSQLPDELKDRFKQFTCNVTLYLNCSDDDISYHIARYNSGKSMNVSQIGLTRLGTHFAKLTKALAEMPFFRENKEFAGKKGINGTIERLITDTVMLINFPDKRINKAEDDNLFLHDNGTVEQYNRLEEDLEILYDVVDEELYPMFNQANFPLWVAIFDIFRSFNVDFELFADFMKRFEFEYKFLSLNGDLSYMEQLANIRDPKRSTIMRKRIAIIVAWMKKHFNIADINEMDAQVENAESPKPETQQENICEEKEVDTMSENSEIQLSEEAEKLIGEFAESDLIKEISAYSDKEYTDSDVKKIALNCASELACLYDDEEDREVSKLLDITAMNILDLYSYTKDVDYQTSKLMTMENLPKLNLFMSEKESLGFYSDNLLTSWFEKVGNEYSGGIIDVTELEDSLEKFSRKN